MKKTVSILIFITIIWLIFTSCHKDKCKSENLGTVKFTNEDLQIVPYKGKDTLRFSDSLGNILSINGYGRSSKFNDMHIEHPLNSDCQGNYFYSENNSTSFMGKDLIIWVILTINNGSPFFQNIKKIIAINVFDETKNWYYMSSFSFNALKIYNTDTNISKILYKDSLKIGYRKFNNVYIFKQINDIDGYQNVQIVFYTINDGVVGIRTKDGHTWYLKN